MRDIGQVTQVVMPELDLDRRIVWHMVCQLSELGNSRTLRAPISGTTNSRFSV
jgi:hypothetical protein